MVDDSSDPLRRTGSKQGDNKAWWEDHPMTYQDWGGSEGFDEGDLQSYRNLDRTFFNSARHFAHPRVGQEPFGELIDFASIEGKRVLEIGCGMGGHAELLARAGCELTAIDLTEVAVRRTRARFAMVGLDAVIQQADASRLPFPDAAFDYVWSWGVIHHSVDPPAIVSEIHRTLVPGGTVKVMVYNRRSLRYWVRGGLQEGVMRRRLMHESLHAINMSFTDGAIAHHYTPGEARDMFDAFRDVKVGVLDGDEQAYLPAVGKRLRRKLPRAMRRVDPWLQARVGWFLLVEARK